MAKSVELVANVDLDGTLADYDLAMRQALEAIASPAEGPVPDLGCLPDWLQRRKDLIRAVPGFWRNLPRLEEGFEVLRLIREAGFTVNVLTKGPKRASAAWTEKVEWCQAHLPDDQVTITQDKGLVYGRVLFDDWPGYVSRWLENRPRGLVIMLEHPWNREFSHPNLVRVRRGAVDSFLSDLAAVRLALAAAASR